MKIKAVVMRPDRTNDIIILRKKDIDGRRFTHDGSAYLIHPDHFQITWGRPWLLWRTYYTTYYYTKGHAHALPVPDFNAILLKGKDANGSNPDEPFYGIKDNGVTGEEFAATFNPWFYRIIGQMTKDPFALLTQWLTIANTAGIAYIIYKMSGG